MISDETLTAYVLGELDENETDEIRRMLEHDPAAAKKAERIRRSADMVNAHYRSEPCCELGGERTRCVCAGAGRRRSPAWLPLAVAAVVLVAACLGVMLMFDADTAGPANRTAAVSGDGRPAAGTVPLDIVLPKPQFEGTPKRIQGITNLEPPKGDEWKRPTFYVPKGTRNLTKGREVASSDDLPIIGEPSMITDGDKEGMDQSVVEFAPGKQWVQIDLGQAANIYAVVIWHYHKQARAYKDVIVQVAGDADMITNKKTIFNNDDDNSSKMGIGKDFSYIETHLGKLIDAGGVRGRYVRLYSNGNSTNDMNHYIEVEVYGKPVQAPAPNIRKPDTQ